MANSLILKIRKFFSKDTQGRAKLQNGVSSAVYRIATAIYGVAASYDVRPIAHNKKTSQSDRVGARHQRYLG